MKGVDLLPAISDTVGDVRGEHVDISLLGYRDSSPPQQLRVRCFASPGDVVGRQFPVTRGEALVRRLRDVLAAAIVLLKANVLEVRGPVIGKVLA